MIIWLASYPRSGNTLCRVLLKQHFGLTTWSLYGDGDERDIGAGLADVVGFEPHGPLDEAALAAMAAADEVFVVKTHEHPPGHVDWPCICVLRDGRSALTSYWHYRNRPGDTAPSLPAVVAGAVQFGSWSAHAAAWLDAPLSRRLVLRYEDLAVPTAETLEAIGAFLGRPPQEAPPPDFTQLHAMAPNHFRAGDDARNIAELEACCPALFNALHGPIQTRLGYPLARLEGGQSIVLAAEIAAALTAEQDARQAEADARRAEADMLRADALRAEADALRAEAGARQAEIDALRREIAGMCNSPFWRARDATVRLIRAAGLRRCG